MDSGPGCESPIEEVVGGVDLGWLVIICKCALGRTVPEEVLPLPGK